jgi:hypothetical protein
MYVIIKGARASEKKQGMDFYTFLSRSNGALKLNTNIRHL